MLVAVREDNMVNATVYGNLQSATVLHAPDWSDLTVLRTNENDIN